MSTLMFAASDAPRSSYTAVRNSEPPAFTSDAERYAWIADQYRRRNAQPGKRSIILARDIAASAFGVNIEQLSGRSRKAPIVAIRHKVVCVILLLTRAGIEKIGASIERHHTTIFDAYKKFGDEVERGLGTSVEQALFDTYKKLGAEAAQGLGVKGREK